MDIGLLREIGLSENEAKIYICLLKEGESSANRISEKTGLHRSYTYDTLSMMVSKGLVSHITRKAKKYFRAVNPKKLLDMAKEREEKIRSIVPELAQLYRMEDSGFQAEVLEGEAGMKTYYERLLDEGIGQRCKEMLFLGLKGETNLKYFTPNFLRRAVDAGKELVEKGKVSSRALYVHSSRGKAYPIKGYQKVRYLPSSVKAEKNLIVIFGDNVAVENWDERPSVVIIKSRQMAAFYTELFELLWKISRE